ncbi:tRNA threonylcarbamoyladenosine biosynthesis protein TsaE [compost metagenome]
MKSIPIKSTADLAGAAEALLTFAEGQKFFVFEGEMAAGKTTFIQAICKALGVEDRVSSPTFSIVNEYEMANDLIYHFDFYRLKSLQEAYDIGYEEYFFSGHYCFIEWPQKVAPLLPENYIRVELQIKSENERVLTYHII